MNQYETYARQIAAQAGLDPDIFASLIQSESGWNPSAVSPTGATGIAQFTRRTAESYGLTDRTDPYRSLDAAASYLSDLVRKRGGDYWKAIYDYKGVAVGGAKTSDVTRVLDNAKSDAPVSGGGSFPGGLGGMMPGIKGSDWQGESAEDIKSSIVTWFQEQGAVLLLLLFALVVLVMSTVRLVRP